MTSEEISASALELESVSAAEILSWAFDRFGRKLAVTSSFQTQSLPLLHLLSKVRQKPEVIFLDTGFHFKETLNYLETLKDRFGIQIRVVKCEMGHSRFREKYRTLYASDPNECCRINKVEPLEIALKEYQGWVSGIRRDQSSFRAETPVISKSQDSKIKICPMVRWTHQEVFNYIEEHDLPVHPLGNLGYSSIGCWPCTKAAKPGEGYRSGRWAGQSKTECGLHLPSSSQNDSSGE